MTMVGLKQRSDTPSSKISFVFVVLLALAKEAYAKNETQVLSSLPSLDLLRKEIKSDITRRGNLDVLSDKDLAICHLPYIMPFTNNEGALFTGINSHEGAFAVALAAQHLNTGDGTIVSRVTNLNQTCPIRFTMETKDTKLQESVGVEHIIDLTDRNADLGERLPCAILGAARSAVSIPTSIISGLREYPQISPISTSSALDDSAQYPLFGRTIPSDDGTAVPLILYLHNVLDVHHLAVLHVDDSYGNAYASGIRAAAQEHAPNMEIRSFDVSVQVNEEGIRNVVQLLKETQYTYFMCVLSSTTQVDNALVEAHSQGIAGTGNHTWIFSDSAGDIPGRPYQRGSPLAQAYEGTGMLLAVGGLAGTGGKYDELREAMSELNNDDDINYMKSILPIAGDHDAVLLANGFLSEPGLMSAFLYDATIALGLAACDTVAERNNRMRINGKEHFQRFAQDEFEGASGTVRFFNESGTRNPQSAVFVLRNFVEDNETSSDDMIQLKAVDSNAYLMNAWEELTPFVYSSGSTVIPPDLPNPMRNPNYLKPGLRALGLILAIIVIGLSVGFSVWSHIYRTTKVVRASQPIFCLIICLGTLIMGFSIVPLIIDRGITGDRGADAACAVFPWLLAIGFSVTFSALFTKTHRINEIFNNAAHFKRVVVTPLDVAKPMMAILGANVLVLSLWTGIDPFHSATMIQTEDAFGRPVETFDICKSNSIAYAAVIAVINLCSLAFALYEAVAAKGISTEYSESDYIFRAMTLIILVFFIGIPVLFIASDNGEAYVFVFAGIIFVVCGSILLLIFGPKILILRKQERKRQAKKEAREKLGAPLSSNTTSTEESQLEGARVRFAATPEQLKQLRKQNLKLKSSLSREVARSKVLQKMASNKLENVSDNGDAPASSSVPDSDSSVSSGDDDQEGNEKSVEFDFEHSVAVKANDLEDGGQKREGALDKSP